MNLAYFNPIVTPINFRLVQSKKHDSKHISLTGNFFNIREMSGFGPAGELLLFRQKDPKPLTPRPASSNETNAGSGRAGQLAVLKQGPPVDGSVLLWDRSAGAEQSGGESSGNSMCHGSFYWHDQRQEAFGNYLEYL